MTVRSNTLRAIWRLSLIVGVAFITSVITCGCEREPLYDETGNLLMQIDIDYNIKHEPEIPEPEMMYVGFYNPDNGQRLRNEFTGPHGGEIFAPPGKYDIMVYNFDTEATVIRNSENINAAEAYTNTAPSQVTQSYRHMILKIKEKLAENSATRTRVLTFENQPLINEPDHLFAGIDWNTEVPIRGNNGEIFTIHADAKTLLETYALSIGPITGMQYIKSLEIYITGQGQSKLIASRKITGEPAVLYIPVELAVRARSEYINTTFRTFGKYPGAKNEITLMVMIVDFNDKTTILTTDITDDFDDPDDDNNIIIDMPIEIQPPVNNGGFVPTVTLWEDNTTQIDI